MTSEAKQRTADILLEDDDRAGAALGSSSEADYEEGDVYRPKAQKAALLAFADAIGAKRKFSQDEAGNPQIGGRVGRVYVQPVSTEPGKQTAFQIYVFGHPSRIRRALEALSFAKVTNRGDEEALFVLKRLPTVAEGETIRDKIKAHKRVVYSEDELARRREAIALVRASCQNTAANAMGSSKILDGEQGGKTR